MILGANDTYICHVQVTQLGGGAVAQVMQEAREANAAFIVKAANCHESLVRALQFTRKYIALRTDRGDEFPSQLVSAIDAALKQAEQP